LGRFLMTSFLQKIKGALHFPLFFRAASSTALFITVLLLFALPFSEPSARLLFPELCLGRRSVILPLEVVPILSSFHYPDLFLRSRGFCGGSLMVFLWYDLISRNSGGAMFPSLVLSYYSLRSLVMVFLKEFPGRQNFHPSGTFFLGPSAQPPFRALPSSSH